jgi:hypothetical protein
VNERLQRALALIDAANGEDPKPDPDNSELPAALLYGWRMSEWLGRLSETPSEALALAARAQHVRRWKVPREQYPEGRSGYLAWRTFLYGFHAEQLSAILKEVGYDPATIERAAALVAKKRLRLDAEAQRLEDVACLVFLNHEFERFSQAHPREKIIAIVQKTWSKMSESGRQAAMSIDFPEHLASLVREALNPPV